MAQAPRAPNVYLLITKCFQNESTVRSTSCNTNTVVEVARWLGIGILNLALVGLLDPDTAISVSRTLIYAALKIVQFQFQYIEVV